VSHANSKSIYNRRKYNKGLREKQTPACRHEIMRPDAGLMVCQRCGYTRLPIGEWEEEQVGPYPFGRDTDSQGNADG
jgi:hypothetical protein